MHRTSRLLALAAITLLSYATRAVAQAPPDGWVVLGVEDYRALRTRALPPLAPPPSLPVDAAITRLDYDLRVDAESVSGRATLTIDVLKDGWTRVPIPSGVMVRDARLNNQPVSLVDGTPASIVLSRPGRSILTLDIVVPIAQAAGAESMSLPASPSPVSRVAIVLPKSGIDLTVTSGVLAEHSESNGESEWIAYGRPNEAIGLSWKRKVDDRRAAQALRVRARITELVGLGEDALLVNASVRVEVLSGLARDVSLALPAGLVVNQVTGTSVADWETTGALLRVSLLEPASGEVSLVVSGEMRAAREGKIAVPIVRVPAAERETGGVAVDVVGAGEIGERQAQGFDPTDPSELGDVLAGRESPSMMAFRMKPLAGSDPRALAVTVVRYTPQAVLVANIEEARYRVLAGEDGWVLVEARYAVRNNQRGFLKVTTRPGVTLWSAAVAGRPVRPGTIGEGEVLLPLEKGRAGEEAPTFPVEIVLLGRIDAWTDKARARIELPALDLPISRTGLTLHYSPRFRIDVVPGAFRLETDTGPASTALRGSTTVDVKTANDKENDSRGDALQALVDRYKNESGGRAAVGILPVRLTFPSFGPSVFLASELTAESRAASVELSVKRVK